MDLENLTTTNRFKLLKILGGKCRICSINEIKYLEIDHIYNDGADERTKYGSSEKIYGWYLQHQNKAFKRLQPLCKEHHEEKHNPILEYKLLQNPKNGPSKLVVMSNILEEMEGKHRTPIEYTLLIKELEKSDKFTEDEAKNYIRRMLREASIYESRPGCYNTV